jgi:hypothetical protein
MTNVLTTTDTPSEGFYAFSDHLYHKTMNFARVPSIGSNFYPLSIVWFVATFEIDALYTPATGLYRGINCQGTFSLIMKNNGQPPAMYQQGQFNRISEMNGLSLNLTHIGFGSYTNYGANRGMSYCDCNVEIIPIPP